MRSSEGSVIHPEYNFIAYQGLRSEEGRSQGEGKVQSLRIGFIARPDISEYKKTEIEDNQAMTPIIKGCVPFT